MIPSLVLAALVAQAPPDPCAPVPAVAPDHPSAAAYRIVGDEERAAGREGSAIAAYRAALARDPGLRPARDALAALCTASQRQEAFTRGLALVRAGDCRAALAPLDEARAAGEPAASLLAGVCRYRLGDDDGAEVALREAERSPDTAASARLYLGLVALRRERPGDAAALLEAAAADPTLQPIARELARAARQEGRVVLSAILEGGWDSNVNLTPGHTFTPSGASSAVGAATGVITVAPWRDRGPYATGAATFRGVNADRSLDLLGFGVALGLPIGPPQRRLLLEYGYDDRALGGEPYLRAHRLLVDARATLAPGWSAGGSYLARLEDYQQADSSGDSGVRHDVELDLSRLLGSALLVTAGWHGVLDLAHDTSRAYAEHGPLVSAALPVGSRTLATLQAGWSWRDYRAVDPNLGVTRADTYLDLAARLEVAVGARWTAYATGAARRAESNIEDFTNSRLVLLGGLSYTLGIP